MAILSNHRSQHLLSTYYMPGTVLGVLYILINLHKNSMKYVDTVVFLHYR